MKPRILAILPGIMPSAQMDVIDPLLALEKRGLIHLRVVLENYPFSLSSERLGFIAPDLVVFCRNSEPKYQNILDNIQEARIPYIYDLDDNLLDVPLTTVDGEYYRKPERVLLLKRYLSNANLVRVYARSTLDQVEKLGGKAELLKPPLDWRAFTPTLHRTTDLNLITKIVYATSRSEDHLAEIFLPALERVLDKYIDKVSMHFWGYQPKHFRQPQTKQADIHYHEFTPNYKRFIKKFSTQGYEIGLAPLLDDEFHRSKTNNKFREYGASGIAGIYSNTPVYANCVEDGSTGLLVPNQTEAWYQAISALIEDSELRAKIGLAARQKVMNDYHPVEFQDIWFKQIQTVIDEPARRVKKNTALEGPTHRSYEGTISPSKNLWLHKIWRGIMSASSVKQFLINSRLHLMNLWWLIKINKLKSL